MTSRAISAVLVCALAFVAAGCGGADTDAMPKAFLALLDDTTKVLKEIKDVPTAKAAEAKLKVLAERKAKLDEQAKTTMMSNAELKASDAIYAEPMKYAGVKMVEEMTRIASVSPEAAEITAAALGMRQNQTPAQ